jgi:uncharacterized protein (DUF1501 family)
MKQTPQAQRRAFLQAGAAFTALGAAVPMGINLAAISSAAAQSTPSDYKALVCVFLDGGNDGHNTVLATDDATYSVYAEARGALKLEKAQLANLSLIPGSAHAGRTFALHPSMGAVQALFNNPNRHVAVVANVGTLLAPTTKQQYLDKSVPLPTGLFSHNDQMSTWLTGGGEGANLGWGGRIGDLVLTGNGGNGVFTCVSPAGHSPWLAGDTAVPYQVVSIKGEAVPINDRATGANDNQTRLYGSKAAAQAFRKVLERRQGLFADEYGKVVQRSIDAHKTLDGALGSNTDTPSELSGNDLAGQLRAVARIIKAANTPTGKLKDVKRQVFFVTAGRFDTHDNQVSNNPQVEDATHKALLTEVSEALAYFYDVMEGAGLINQVTTFTASEFGRALQSNDDGSDHGWGSHHFVMGGAVKGGEIYGQWPDLSKNGPDTVEVSRSLLPRISVDQYGATLCRWFGLTEDQIKTSVFPNLNGAFLNRADYPLDLGFMKSA